MYVSLKIDLMYALFILSASCIAPSLGRIIYVVLPVSSNILFSSSVLFIFSVPGYTIPIFVIPLFL